MSGGASGGDVLHLSRILRYHPIGGYDTALVRCVSHQVIKPCKTGSRFHRQVVTIGPLGKNDRSMQLLELPIYDNPISLEA